MGTPIPVFIKSLYISEIWKTLYVETHKADYRNDCLSIR